MPRIPEIADADAPPPVVALFDAAHASIGAVPNVFRSMAHSPATLSGFMTLLGGLQSGMLDRKLQQQVAVLVAQFDGSTYCLAINTAVGLHVGLDEAAIVAARRGHATDPRAETALAFVRALLEARGAVTDAAFTRLREAGFTFGEIAELLGHVGLNLFANYFNLVAQTTPDFPAVPLALAMPA